MRQRQINCPACHAVLQIPPGHADCVVRCGHCKHRFRLPKCMGITDDTVASWLQDGARLRDADDDVSISEPSQESVSGSTVVLSAHDVPETAVHESQEDQIRLLKFGGAGALFEFAASHLKDIAFRCAMPRRCLRCGARSHLLAHVIIYSPQLVDNMSLEAEHAAGQLMLREDVIRDLSCDQMLDRLPLVPNVPAPGNLPMPYWVCDMCSGANLISGQIQVNSETGNGSCRLKVRNLRRAEEFLERAGGKESKSYQVLHAHLESASENPWEQLPSVIQHRVEQWFKPASGEQFMAYVADRDHTRTEDGMSGLLISNKRLIYHTRLRHQESLLGQDLKITVSSSAGKMNIRLDTPKWQVKHLVLDRDGANLLRRSLTLGSFQPVWQ